jgi:hypothetical protein
MPNHTPNAMAIRAKYHGRGDHSLCTSNCEVIRSERERDAMQSQRVSGQSWEDWVIARCIGWRFEPDGAAADLIEIAFIVARMLDEGMEISGAIHEAILSPGRLIEWARQGESRITDVRANAAIGLLDSM